MHARDHDGAQDAERSRVARPKAEAPLVPPRMPLAKGGAAAASVQAWQHTVGNRAVTRMVQRSTSPDSDLTALMEAAGQTARQRRPRVTPEVEAAARAAQQRRAPASQRREIASDARLARAWLEQNSGTPTDRQEKTETVSRPTASTATPSNNQTAPEAVRRQKAPTGLSFDENQRLYRQRVLQDFAGTATLEETETGVTTTVSANPRQWAHRSQKGIMVTRDITSDDGTRQ